MANGLSRRGPGRGRITSGITSNTLIERTLDFVWGELPSWRDDPNRPHEESEEGLNAQLCKYLNVASRQRFPMIHFHHEEKQTGRRRVDFSALPTHASFVGSAFSIYSPFLVFEGKRLPSPTLDRDQEYVTGGAARSGGIQRFKLGLHGAEHKTAAIIGYVQEGEFISWLNQVNDWIQALAKTKATTDDEWSTCEQLTALNQGTPEVVFRCHSTHPRTVNLSSNTICLFHLWVNMVPRPDTGT